MTTARSESLEQRGFGPRFVAPVVSGSILNPINSTVNATVLVHIERTFSAGAATTAWLVAGLCMASAIAQPATGKVADRSGARRVYLLGPALVAVAGAADVLAPTLGLLITVRVVLGVGTAAYPAAMALVRSQSRRVGREAPRWAP